jgi:hypothetical protein
MDELDIISQQKYENFGTEEKHVLNYSIIIVFGIK